VLKQSYDERLTSNLLTPRSSEVDAYLCQSNAIGEMNLTNHQRVNSPKCYESL
jgi:hypothetical protein